MSKKALIAMSGGVDSSVAALMMVQQGYDCIGATMKLFNNEDIGESCEKTCCSLSDVEDARSVATQLGMPYFVFNFSHDFDKQVIERFVTAYEKGETPNPCIDCNRYMKFEKLLHRAKELEIDYVVTGHYARIEYDETTGRYLLKKGLDDTKDQSYVLYAMTQDQLKHTLLPLGGLEKSEVRRIAEENGFVNSHKKDSQDICFIRNGDYASFIAEYTGKTYAKGKFMDTNGKILGEHQGIIRYTTGQRKGLNLSLPESLYVVSKDMANNNVILGKECELFKKEFLVQDFNWIAFEKPSKPFNASVKIRYKQKEQPATIIPLEENLVKIEFAEPQRAITSGQAAVAYRDDVVIGGGTIKE